MGGVRPLTVKALASLPTETPLQPVREQTGEDGDTRSNVEADRKSDTRSVCVSRARSHSRSQVDPVSAKKPRTLAGDLAMQYERFAAKYPDDPLMAKWQFQIFKLDLGQALTGVVKLGRERATASGYAQEAEMAGRRPTADQLREQIRLSSLAEQLAAGGFTTMSKREKDIALAELEALQVDFPTTAKQSVLSRAPLTPQPVHW